MFDDVLVMFMVAEDKWPEAPSSSSSDDNWADFTAMKPDDWPPPQSQSEDAWQVDDGENTVLSPTAAAVTEARHAKLRIPEMEKAWICVGRQAGESIFASFCQQQQIYL
ncbi:unnamed protein product [Gongylonema pulchrum]|uniref:40S_SA_C domain-containing protein n=1 Tax=Gongylonema pulchrum TaxID=637853 RepID=A0A183EM89_9BILA|nr:unnamed protein product [Gongylonema pulchrum]